MQKVYSILLAKYKQKRSKLKQKNRRIAYARGLVFLTGLVLISVFWSGGVGLVSGLIFITLIPFLLLVKTTVQLKFKIRNLDELVKINEQELKNLDGKPPTAIDGREFIDFNHNFTYDLDIFGEKSIFHYLNRTCTYSGKQLLSKWLKNPEKNKNTILLRQEAIQNLSTKTDWRQSFQAYGNMEDEGENFHSQHEKSDNTGRNEIKNWLMTPPQFINRKGIKVLLLLSPAFALLLLLAGLFSSIPLSFFGLYGFLQLGIIGLFLKKINKQHNDLSRSEQILNKFIHLIDCIENENFSAHYLKQLQNQLHIEESKAKDTLQEFKKLVKAFDNRLNVFFSLGMNFLFLWDLQCVVRLEKWKGKHKEHLPGWFSVIAHFDALLSFAGMAANRPDMNYPVISDKKFELNIRGGGHVLLSPKSRIDNNFEMQNQGQIAIITGANMAGKSTFLRTAGTNLVLAMCGSAVCADAFVFSPLDIFTSLRMNDSLQKNESYFYAELKRLQAIIKAAKEREQLFVIIDEMLRGTNSKDKHEGSVAYTKQLIKQNACGLIATHDISLGKLAEVYPENVKNLRFEVKIKDKKLFFDYKLRSGISKSLNATFLMKQMGITV